jgi:polyisoprenoid-binding protein YceI
MSTTVAIRVPAGTWKLDPVHSTVGFEVPYLVGLFKGELKDVEATLTVSDGSGRLEGRARVDSIDVNDETLASHLKSPEFFDAERHPELTFRAEGISLARAELSFPGEITIKGVTQPVQVEGVVSEPLTDPFGRERIGLTLSATVDRTAFGITWNAPLPNGQQALANEVTIRADLFFLRAQEGE